MYEPSNKDKLFIIPNNNVPQIKKIEEILDVADLRYIFDSQLDCIDRNTEDFIVYIGVDAKNMFSHEIQLDGLNLFIAFLEFLYIEELEAADLVPSNPYSIQGKANVIYKNKGFPQGWYFKFTELDSYSKIPFNIVNLFVNDVHVTDKVHTGWTLKKNVSN